MPVIDELEIDVDELLEREADFAGRGIETLSVFGEVTARAGALAASPVLDGVRRLEVTGDPVDGGILDAQALATLLGSPHLGALTALHLDDNELGVEGAEVIVRSGRRFGTLGLCRTAIGTDGLRLLAAAPLMADLVCLDVDNCGIGAGGVRALAESAATQLMLLDLGVSSVEPDELALLFRSPAALRLRDFAFGWPRAGLPVVDAIAGDGVGPRLHHLELAQLRLCDGGARRLAGAPAARSLRRLRLVICTIGEPEREMLRELPALGELELVSCLGPAPTP